MMIKGGLWIAIFLITVTFQDLTARDASPKCFKEIQKDFFQETTVRTALSFHTHRVARSLWSRISRELVAANRRIPRLMQEEAKLLSRNPLQKPFQPEAAIELLQSVTWNLFLEVMNDHQITDSLTIQESFTYIFDRKSRRIQKCLQNPRR